jgi:hypothetical protein
MYTKNLGSPYSWQTTGILTLKEGVKPILPEDCIELIASFLIKKIPKTDTRYTILHAHLRTMKKQELFYNDGTFKGYYLTFRKHYYIMLMRILPGMFIEYQFQNMITNEYTCDRCWFTLSDAYQTRNNYWDQVDSRIEEGWRPNPNTECLLE